MLLGELSAGLDKSKRIKTKELKALNKLGIKDIKTLLTHYPRNWEDRSRNVPLKEWNSGQVYTKAKVLVHQWFGKKYPKILKIYIQDDTGMAALVCFNQAYLADKLTAGSEIFICGKFEYNARYAELQSTNFEIGNDAWSFGRIVPVYPLSEGISQNRIRNFVHSALEIHAGKIDNELPSYVIERENFLSKKSALKEIHFPSSFDKLDAAKKTLIYEELFFLQIPVIRRVMERKKSLQKEDNPQEKKTIKKREEFTPMQKRLLERLSFSLTEGQESSIKEINSDMDNPYPMSRLLQGDVGSGKTLVSFLACLKAIEQGAQACIMAPTELLARQHAENAAMLLEPLGIHIAYLSGNVKSKGRASLLKALVSGEIDIAAGTHALFSKDTVYKNLRLVVVDEQHRFGVSQREAIASKGESPHLLLMSATPIPRTLALTTYGDLDVSVIRDMPPGRKPIKTHLNKTSNADKVYNFVRKELALEHQAYFVYPLIESNEVQDLKDAESMAEMLSKQIFPEYTVALIHSRLNEEEKRRIMEKFRSGETKILAATSVVEVGVDVPNASCMVVEHAERFGLAALHQLRGRVGRGDTQSYCFLVYSDQEILPERSGIDPELLSEEERTKEGKRLMVMLQNTDGFVIAEKDLQFRGPGQISGLQQSGYLALTIADVQRDSNELLKAHNDAFNVLQDDPDLVKPENRQIATVLEKTIF